MSQTIKESSEIKHIDPSKCYPWRFHNRAINGYQTNVDTLIKSIDLEGQHTPGLVRETDTGDEYEIIFGYRRSLACGALGIEYMARVIPRTIDDTMCMKMMHSENEERVGISPLQDARTYQLALDRGVFVNQEHLAQLLCLSQGRVSKILRTASLFRYDWLSEPLLKAIDDISLRQAHKVATALNDVSTREKIERYVSSSEVTPSFESIAKYLDQLSESGSSKRSKNLVLHRSGRKKIASISIKSDGECNINISPYQWSESDFKSLMLSLSKEIILAHGGDQSWINS